MIARLIWTRLVRYVGVKTLLSLALLLFTLNGLYQGLIQTAPTLPKGPLFGAILAAVLLAWLVDHFSFRPLFAAMFLSAVGVSGTVIYFSELFTPLLALARLVLAAFWRAILNVALSGVPLDLPAPDAIPLNLAILEINTRLASWWGRIIQWGAHIGGGKEAFDPVAAGSVWSLVLWACTGWAAWMVFRRRSVFWGTVPAGLLLAFSLNLVRGNTFWLLVYWIGTLWLASLVHHSEQESRWQLENTDYSLEVRHDRATTALLLGIVIALAMFFASLLPPRPVESVQAWLDRAGEKGKLDGVALGESFGLQKQESQPESIRRWGAAGLPRQHLLGSGPELSEQVVMTVRVTQDTLSIAGDAPSPHRYYWRAITYDHYTGLGWRTSPVSEISFRAGQLSVLNLPQRSQIMEASIDLLQDEQGLVYAPGEILSLDRPYRLALRQLPLSGEITSGPGAGPDAASAERDLFTAIAKASRYQVQAQQPIASEQDLRAAGARYPDWVRQRYLQLPDSIPERVRDKAVELTRHEMTPYDKVVKIEAYLRQFPYTLDLPAPPQDRDVVDYFLFDLRKGYCDYYATSMVVLARLAGIPARLVVGYQSGIYDAANHRYIVRLLDAHSWIEIYFPNIGWIEFEPTASFPQRIIPPEISLSEGDPIDLESLGSFERPGLVAWQAILSIGIVSLAVFGAIYSFWVIWKNHNLSPEQAIRSLYRRFYQMARTLAGTERPDRTSIEFAASLIHHLRQLESAKSPLISSIHAAISRLTDHYNRLIFSQHPLGIAEQDQAYADWRKLRLRLWVARLKKLAKRFLKIRNQPTDTF